MKEWQKFKTTRMYLHPPKAERLITLWREGKMMLGESEYPIDKPYTDVSAAGIWFVYGDGEQADFRENQWIIREDGIPIHALSLHLGAISAKLECVTDFVKKPTGFARLVLKNDTEDTITERIGYLVRSGKEHKLIFGSPDVYASYAPDVNTWHTAPVSWTYDGIWHSGEYFVSCSDSCFACDVDAGAAYAEITLAPQEERVVYFSLGKGNYQSFNFDTVKAGSIAAWENEFKRVKNYPASALGNPEQMKMVKCLIALLLQCFGVECETGDMLERQGCLQRWVWTFENMPVLEALWKLGDFDDYISPVIDVYFNRFYEETGEIIPLGLHWAMATGTVLKSFSGYAMNRGKEFYLKYRDKAMHSFEWIRDTRRKTEYDGGANERETLFDPNYYRKVNDGARIIEGLFPPMPGSDDQLVFQNWLSTDCNTLVGLAAFADAVEMFEDPRADEVRAEYLDYFNVIRGCFDKILAEAGDSDELKIPLSPSDNNDEVEKKYCFSAGTGMLVRALKMEKEEYEKIIRYYERRGFIRGGLYFRMPDIDPTIPGASYRADENGRSYIWYVCQREYEWFKNFIYHGDIKRCKEILKDNLKYAMSDEYYMLERFHVRDPWYSPWSPNASANGRMLIMLLEMSNIDL